MPPDLACHPGTLIALGVCAGLLSGMLGVGSGTIVVPALVVILAYNQKLAQGTCLAVMVPMALTGAIRYKLNPDIHVDMYVVAIIAVGAVVGSLIGTQVAAYLPRAVLRKMFAVLLILVATKMLWPKSTPANGAADNTEQPALTAITNPGGDANDG